MVLIILIYVEGQTNSPIFIHQPPDPVPNVHLTKREKHPLLLHECIVYEVEGCSRKPIHGRKFYKCIVKSFENCIKKPLYLNEPIYNLLNHAKINAKSTKNPCGLSNCITHCYVRHTKKKIWKWFYNSLSLSL